MQRGAVKWLVIGWIMVAQGTLATWDATHPLATSTLVYSAELIGGDLAVSALGIAPLTCSGDFDLTAEIPNPMTTAIDAAYVVLIARSTNSNPSIGLTFDGAGMGNQTPRDVDQTSGVAYELTYLWNVETEVTDPGVTSYHFQLSNCSALTNVFGIALIVVISDSSAADAHLITINVGCEAVWNIWMTVPYAVAQFDADLMSGTDYRVELMGSLGDINSNEYLDFESVPIVNAGDIFNAANGSSCTWFTSGEFSYSGGSGVQTLN
ncbi:hypothetical protein JXA80_01565, partial [bacterium]|nr:hypothetical protein [candidate division CSSED10-310 bacterium]